MSDREHPFELLKSWQEAMTLMTSDVSVRVEKLKGLMALFPEVKEPVGRRFYMDVDPALLQTESSSADTYINIPSLKFEGMFLSTPYLTAAALNTLSVKFCDLVLLDDNFDEDPRPDDLAVIPILAVRQYVDLGDVAA